MDSIYDTIEAILVWGTVIFAFGLVGYLAYLQYLKVKHRRARRRHRAHRSRRHSDEPIGEHRPSHSHQS